MALKVVTPPAVEPVTLEEIKAWCSLPVDDAGLDALLTGWAIPAVRQQGETLTRRQFVAATLDLTLDRFPRRGGIELPRPPLQSVEGITYVDPDGADTEMDPELYRVVDVSDGVPPYVVPVWGACWPQTRAQAAAVTVRYVTGWPVADASGETVPTTPSGIRQWIAARCSELVDNRERFVVGTGAAVSELPRSHLDGLLDPYVVREAR